MRRPTTSKKQYDTSKIITTKTPYGTHSEMVVDSSEFDVILKENEVLCSDEKGHYVTLKTRIDSGLADPNRYCNRKNIEKKVEQTAES